MKCFSFCMLACGLTAVLSGCATVGRNFPEEYASGIVINQTNRADIEKALGAPFRTGLDSGAPTATYLYYHFSLFAEPVTKDLTVTYTPDNKVKSYTFNSNADSSRQKRDDSADADYVQQ